MRQTSKVEGTKIAQAAKDLNVTSVTIRRYLAEFNIDTATDANGIKVLPGQAMEELKEIRKLKEDGLTNPKVLEMLEERQSQAGVQPPPKSNIGNSITRSKERVRDSEVSKLSENLDEIKSADKKKGKRTKAEEAPVESTSAMSSLSSESTTEQEDGDGATVDSRPKHSLTCQTCGQVFEHMNPKLRDCLDCYRTKRKERRRGSSDRHKNVIQHPLAQQVTSKTAQLNTSSQSQNNLPFANDNILPASVSSASSPLSNTPLAAPAVSTVAQPFTQRAPVRNYRKAIEETRQITGSLKRRLERPDLPEGERRWLEQIYAYQLILHQGWRHLADYKSANQGSGKPEESH